MYRFPLYRPLICAGLGLLSWQALAAYQPQSEAALAADAEMECQFNADHSSDCTTTQHYTILTPAGREMLSRIDFSYAETDGFELRKAEFTQPGGKPIALAPAQIDTRTAPNPEQGFLREKQTSLAFPNLRVGTRLSYTVQQHYAAKPLLGQFHSVLQFGPKPVRQDSFKITYRATRPIIWRSEQMDDYRFTASSDRKNSPSSRRRRSSSTTSMNPRSALSGRCRGSSWAAAPRCRTISAHWPSATSRYSLRRCRRPAPRPWPPCASCRPPRKSPG